MYPPPTSTTPPRSELSRLFLRWLIYSLAIFAAVWIVPGIEFTGPGWQIGIVALLFGLLNALLRPLLYFLTCPLVILTLGLFGLVINALLLGLTSALADQLGINFVVNGFWPAFFGGMVISIVSTTLQYLAGDVQFRIVVERRPRD
ncbi:phage holin family protein [Chloroflexus sp.]|uniref:phage holin family protein n=1 Tax=Chloroflexus sp. TaxID=1904827 RepID=UPI00298EDD0E|nr:phage holin family protein [Chloroflexus sp.]MCS6889221.1 phage holin family protein [Chloroflexus sp.]MDW8405993.1 phage holin family protein [Chloroflexus sp.]